MQIWNRVNNAILICGMFVGTYLLATGYLLFVVSPGIHVSEYLEYPELSKHTVQSSICHNISLTNTDMCNLLYQNYMQSTEDNHIVIAFV